MEVKLAAIKLITGEEVVCNIINVSEDSTTLHIRDVYSLSVEYTRRGSAKFSLTPWFYLGTDRNVDLSVANVITMSKVEDEEVREMFLELLHATRRRLPHTDKPSSKEDMGYIGSVTEYKKVLEKLYKDIDAVEPPIDT